MIIDESLHVYIGQQWFHISKISPNKLEIACGDNQSIKILEIQRQGKKPQKIDDFLLGSKIKKGSIISDV